MTATIHNVFQSKLAEKALKDPTFAQQLQLDPKGAIASISDIQLPNELQVKVLLDSSSTVHVVVPYIANPITEDDNSVDDEILAGCTWGPNCQSSITPNG
jgi:hypothetical protein